MKNKKEAMATLEVRIPVGSQRYPRHGYPLEPNNTNTGLTMLCLLISTTKEVRYD
jgi:hypothetical protein